MDSLSPPCHGIIEVDMRTRPPGADVALPAVAARLQLYKPKPVPAEEEILVRLCCAERHRSERLRAVVERAALSSRRVDQAKEVHSIIAAGLAGKISARLEAARRRREQMVSLIALRARVFVTRHDTVVAACSLRAMESATLRRQRTSARMHFAALLRGAAIDEIHSKAHAVTARHAAAVEAVRERRVQKGWEIVRKLTLATEERNRHIHNIRSKARLTSTRIMAAHERVRKRVEDREERVRRRLQCAESRRQQAAIARRLRAGASRLRHGRVTFARLERMARIATRIERSLDNAQRNRRIEITKRQAKANMNDVRGARAMLFQARHCQAIASRASERAAASDRRRHAALAAVRARAAVASERLRAIESERRRAETEQPFFLSCRINFSLMGHARSRQERLEEVRERARVASRRQKYAAMRRMHMQLEAAARYDTDTKLASAAINRTIFIEDIRNRAAQENLKVEAVQAEVEERVWRMAMGIDIGQLAAEAKREAVQESIKGKARDVLKRCENVILTQKKKGKSLATKIDQDLAAAEMKREHYLDSRRWAASLMGDINEKLQNAAMAEKYRAFEIASKLDADLQAAEEKHFQAVEARKERASAMVSHHESVVAAQRARDEEERDALAQRIHNDMCAATERREAFVAMRVNTSTRLSPRKASTSSRRADNHSSVSVAAV